jgi:hypothetical protein
MVRLAHELDRLRLEEGISAGVTGSSSRRTDQVVVDALEQDGLPLLMRVLDRFGIHGER